MAIELTQRTARLYNAELRAAELGQPLFRNSAENDSLPGFRAVFASVLPRGYDGWYIPPGVYMCDATGPIDLPGSVQVSAAGARFDITADGDAFEFYPADTDAETNIYWRGGLLNARDQPVPASVPYGSSYTPPQGVATGSCDALAFKHGVVDDGSGGFEVTGTFGHVEVTGAKFTGSADGHWEFAGGDSGIYVSSCSSSLVAFNDFLATRASGVYYSESQDRTGSLFPVVQDVVVRNNRFIGSSSGVTMKRGGRRFLVTENDFDNLIFAATVTEVSGHPLPASGYIVDGVTFTNNRARRCWRPIRVEKSTNVTIAGNTLAEFGMDMLDSDQPPATITGSKQEHIGIELDECVNYTVGSNTIGDLIPEYESNGWTFTATDITDVGALADVTDQGVAIATDGSADAAPGLQQVLESTLPPGAAGWLIPAGTYAINTSCAPLISNDLSVVATGATFEITVDGNGIDLVPADLSNHSVTWVGGTFDQRAQPVSTSVPFLDAHPPTIAPVGVSSTTDGLAIQHRVQSDGSGGFEVIGTFGDVAISDATFIGHDEHWELAGGDSGIYVSTCDSMLITRCTFQGCRDLGIYLSESQDRTGAVKPIVEDVTVNFCTFTDCASGVAAKRGGRRIEVHDCTFANNWLAIGATIVNSHPIPPSGYVFDDITFRDNAITRCQVGVEAELVNGLAVAGNTMNDFGMDIEDPLTNSQPNYQSDLTTRSRHFGIKVTDCADYTVTPNTIGTLEASYALGGWPFTEISAPTLGTATSGGGTNTAAITATFNDAPAGGETLLVLVGSSARTYTGTGVTLATETGSFNSGRFSYYRYPSGTTSVTFTAVEGASFLSWIAVPIANPGTIEFAETNLGGNATSDIELAGLAPVDGTVTANDLALWFIGTHDNETFTQPADVVIAEDGHNAALMLVADTPAAGASVPARTFARVGATTSQEMGLTVLVSAP